MKPFESNIEDPLYFFKSFLNNDGVGFLRKNFESNDQEDSHRFVAERDLITLLRNFRPGEEKGTLVDEETNLFEIEITFDEYRKEEVAYEVLKAKRLIKEFWLSKGKDQNAWLYDKILIFSLQSLKYLEKKENVEKKKFIETAIISILNYSCKLYSFHFPNAGPFSKVNEYMQNRNGIKKKRNGHILKTNYSPKQLFGIYERGVDLGFISENTTRDEFAAVFSGWRPINKIVWADNIYTLAFFIKSIEGHGLESIGRGKWLIVSDMFSTNDFDLLKPNQLSGSSPGKHERLNDLNFFIEEFNNPI